MLKLSVFFCAIVTFNVLGNCEVTLNLNADPGPDVCLDTPIEGVVAVPPQCCATNLTFVVEASQTHTVGGLSKTFVNVGLDGHFTIALNDTPPVGSRFSVTDDNNSKVTLTVKIFCNGIGIHEQIFADVVKICDLYVELADSLNVIHNKHSFKVAVLVIGFASPESGTVGIDVTPTKVTNRPVFDLPFFPRTTPVESGTFETAVKAHTFGNATGKKLRVSVDFSPSPSGTCRCFGSDSDVQVVRVPARK